MITRTLDPDRLFVANHPGTIAERRARRIAGERLPVLPYEAIAEWVQAHGFKPEDVSTVDLSVIEDDGHKHLRLFTFDRNASGKRVVTEAGMLKTEHRVPLVVEPPCPDLWRPDE